MLVQYLVQELVMIHLDLDEFKNAQSCAENALNLSQKNHEIWLEGISWTILGKILGKKEPPEIDRAEEHILKGIKILEELKVKPYFSRGYFFLGELHADAGQKERARENLIKAEKMFREMEMDYWLTRTQEVLGRL